MRKDADFGMVVVEASVPELSSATRRETVKPMAARTETPETSTVKGIVELRPDGLLEDPGASEDAGGFAEDQGKNDAYADRVGQCRNQVIPSADGHARPYCTMAGILLKKRYPGSGAQMTGEAAVEAGAALIETFNGHRGAMVAVFRFDGVKGGNG
jgi:hypothetical protein